MRCGLEDVFWRADRTPLQVSVSTQAIRDGEKVIGGVVNFSDISARLEVEKSREAAQKAAERLVRIKSEFLANMSHEIRTPLNGVLGMAQIGYRESIGRGRAKEIFSRIMESGKLLLGVINDILDFSKIESGKLSLESVPVDLRRSIDAALATLKDRADEKGLALLAKIEPEVPVAILSDPVRLSQILLNLLSNAVKFTAKGEVRLTCSMENNQLAVSVADTGIGMTEEQLGRLFQTFEQADSTTTRKYGGSGLGLVISRRLAEMMGGDISVVSVAGSGSTFMLCLPCIAVPLTADILQPVVARVNSGPRLKNIRILAAEDNELNRMVLEDLLVHEGVQLTMVVNGRLAVEAIERDQSLYDVVLMDVQMPQMDGLEATRCIRLLAPDLPVIGQTAHALADEHAQCRAAGMTDVITKPIDADDLVAIVLRHRATVVKAANLEVPVNVIDWQQLALQFGARPALLSKMAAIFLEMNAETPSRLRTAANATQLAAIAQSLERSANYWCAHEVQVQVKASRVSLCLGDVDLRYHAEVLATAVESMMDEIGNRLAGIEAILMAGAAASVKIEDTSRQSEIDWSALLERYQGRQAFVDKLLQLTLQSHHSVPSELRVAAEAGEFAELALIAHRFAGVAGALQADSLQQFAREVEQKARAGQPEVISQALELSSAIDRFMLALQQKLTATLQVES